MSDDGLLKHVLAYTDGSAIKQIKDKKKYHGGAGIVLIYNGKEKHISVPIEDGTNNISEITAAIVALRSLKTPCKVTLFTDSQYVINCITKWMSGFKRRGWKTSAGADVKNKHLLIELSSLCDIHTVDWKWVKGHNGDKFNELADELACKASASLKDIEEKSIEC